jgi:hypothetical protein
MISTDVYMTLLILSIFFVNEGLLYLVDEGFLYFEDNE